MTPERLAELRYLADKPNGRRGEDVAELLAEVDRLREEVAGLERDYRKRIGDLRSANGHAARAQAEVNRLRAQVAEVFDLFTYERNGHRYTSMHGDADVTDLVPRD